MKTKSTVEIRARPRDGLIFMRKYKKKEVRYVKMNYAAPIIDGYNAVVGTIAAVLSYILGDHWILFLAFLLLNVADWITGRTQTGFSFIFILSGTSRPYVCQWIAVF